MNIEPVEIRIFILCNISNDVKNFNNYVFKLYYNF